MPRSQADHEFFAARLQFFGCLMSHSQTDMLEMIFKLQAELNDHVFLSNGLRDNDGQPLSMATIIKEVTAGSLSVNALPNRWLGQYARAYERRASRA